MTYRPVRPNIEGLGPSMSSYIYISNPVPDAGDNTVVIQGKHFGQVMVVKGAGPPGLERPPLGKQRYR